MWFKSILRWFSSFFLILKNLLNIHILVLRCYFSGRSSRPQIPELVPGSPGSRRLFSCGVGEVASPGRFWRPRLSGCWGGASPAWRSIRKYRPRWFWSNKNDIVSRNCTSTKPSAYVGRNDCAPATVRTCRARYPWFKLYRRFTTESREAAGSTEDIRTRSPFRTATLKEAVDTPRHIESNLLSLSLYKSRNCRDRRRVVDVTFTLSKTIGLTYNVFFLT